MVAGGILAGIGIAERIFGFELATLTGGNVRFDAAIDQTRISGPYPAPEPYALSLLICFAATLYVIASRRGARGHLLAWGIATLQVVGIALSLFRAAWIGAILVLIASIGVRPGRFGRAFGVTAVVLAIAFAAASGLQQNKTFATRTHNTDNIYGRLATYEQGLAIFGSAPVFGIGVNDYNTVSQKLPPKTVHGVQSVTFPHSSYVGTLAEQGIFGFAPLLFLTYGVWRLIRGIRREAFGDHDLSVLTGTVTAAALAYLVMSLSLTMLPYGPSNSFFAVFLAVVAARLDRVRTGSRAAASQPKPASLNPAPARP
jgi:O-antigen ligase